MGSRALVFEATQSSLNVPQYYSDIETILRKSAYDQKYFIADSTITEISSKDAMFLINHKFVADGGSLDLLTEINASHIDMFYLGDLSIPSGTCDSSVIKSIKFILYCEVFDYSEVSSYFSQSSISAVQFSEFQYGDKPLTQYEEFVQNVTLWKQQGQVFKNYRELRRTLTAFKKHPHFNELVDLCWNALSCPQGKFFLKLMHSTNEDKDSKKPKYSILSLNISGASKYKFECPVYYDDYKDAVIFITSKSSRIKSASEAINKDDILSSLASSIDPCYVSFDALKDSFLEPKYSITTSPLTRQTISSYILLSPAEDHQRYNDFSELFFQTTELDLLAIWYAVKKGKIPRLTDILPQITEACEFLIKKLIKKLGPFVISYTDFFDAIYNDIFIQAVRQEFDIDVKKYC